MLIRLRVATLHWMR